ncbi:hypothetical protein J7L27_01165 [Candidatus Bathyarchaeota archaeon]|nr:hypothetical protein [Candidatus Bathyarchaeota archaeon]
MEPKRKIIALILVLAILLTDFSFLIPVKILCDQKNFTIIEVIAKSSSGSSKIYPGSKRVSLKIEAMYLSNKTARAVTGHLELPYGIEFSAGSGKSAPARTLNGSVALKVEKGDHVTFDYYLDVSEQVDPGTFTLTLNITYRLELNATLLSETHDITLTISPYPEIYLRVVDAYLSPASSPGSTNTNLYVLLENAGESRIDSADFEVDLPSQFRIDNPRVRIGAVNINERFTLSFSGISISLTASTGFYTAKIYVDATMRTEDNVNYEDTSFVRVQFKVTNPPEEEPIMVSSVAVLYQGSPAPLLPSARGVTIRITLINRLPDAVSAMIITPELPNGIVLQSMSGTYINGMTPGGSCFLDMTVNVSSSFQPGRYDIPLSISYVRIVSGASYMGEQAINITVTVESPHSYLPEISLTTAYWGSTNPTLVYKGSQHVPLTLRFMNNGRYDVVGGVVNASSEFLKPIKDSDALSVRLAPGAYSSVTLYYDVNAEAGNIPLYISVGYFFDAFGTHIKVTRNFVVYLPVEEYPEIDLRVVDAYLSPASYPGSTNTNLYVILENAGKSRIDSANFEVSLPPEFTIKNPRASVSAVNRGERFTLVFSGISIPSDTPTDTYHAEIYVDATMRTEDDYVSYNEYANIDLWFKITAMPKEQPIMVSSVAVLYQGSPAPLLPSAREVTIRVSLINRLSEAVSAMAITPELPEGIILQSVSGTYVNGIPAGSSAYIDLTVNVSSSIQPGRYIIPLNISYVRIVSGASYMADQTVNVTVTVESPHSYLPEVSLISAYWGLQNPTPVYEGSQYVPLTLRFVNDGRYNVVGGIVRASSEFLRPIKDSEALAARLAPGASSSVVLYFDVNAEAGEIPVNVSINYVFNEFGTHINATRSFRVYLMVEKYSASASNLMVVSSGWQNNYNVFPRTENATYQVTLVNRAPFSVGGIILSLGLPENMSSGGNAYIEGPIRSLDTFTVSFSVSVGNIQPGSYNATLKADFILLSGGPGVRCVEEFNLTINVNDDSQAVEFVSAKWYGGSVGPYTYGAHLLIFIRNNYVDSMRGTILELYLPDGMISVLDNSSYVKVTPLSTSFTGFTQPIQARDLSSLINAYLGAPQAGAAQAFSKGDILTFIIDVNILDLEVGIHYLNGELSYIDQWGSKRTVKVTIPVAILGRTEYVEVHMSGSLSIRSRFTNTSLAIRNVGSSPIYDVYVIISSYQGMPLLVASPTITHIRRIGANEEVNLPITLTYNPLGFLSQTGGTTIITYGPVPFLVSIVYRDASGSLKSFNNTVVVVVEPFIDLLVKDIRAIGRNTSSTITGVIVNRGSATAYRVEAIFQVNGVNRSMLVGDIEPGSELAFRVEVPKYGENGTLRITYYNIFDEFNSREMNVKIEPQFETKITPVQEEGMGFEKWIVIGVVAAFLSIAAFLIYRLLRKSRSITRV